MGIAVVLAIAVLVNVKNQPRTGSASVSTGEGPEQIVDRGACPYEGCKYGEKWLARKDTDLYLAPPALVGASVSSLERRMVVHAGTWVRTETGVVLAARREARVSRDAVVNGMRLKQGQVISVYSYLGEGCLRSWLGAQWAVVCNADVQGQPKQEWWIQVRTADGAQVWTNAPTGSFVSEEGLNSELGEKIADNTLALTEKLTQVDALLKEGANLNGSGGKYGTDPMWATIRTNDVDLLRMLISRGLNIRSQEPCPAYVATQGSVLDPGGDVMLDFLLENGLQLECLREPPLHAFLRFGMATDNFPVDRAVRVADVLVRHGANLNQRDSQGKSLFQVIDEAMSARAASRAASLKEDLTAIAGRQNQDPPSEAISVPPSRELDRTSISGSGYGDPGSKPKLDVRAEARPEQIDSILASAEKKVENGDYDGAMIEAQRATRLFPRDERARLMLERVRRIKSILR